MRTAALIGWLFLIGTAGAAPAQPVAFVHVNLIPMDRERVEPDQTLLVRGDRIVAVGAAADAEVPGDATVVNGEGLFLLPGLVDGHVHLEGFGPGPRENFADGKLYLANGITTVVNLLGTPTQLDWRRRVEAGTLVGPTIYTSGAFINEPRVRTPEEVRREIAAQAREGYDLIKYHELENTTTGLSLDAYRTMIEATQEAGLLFVGHAPNNLGLDVLLEARQPLAHVGNLSNIYFLPLASHTGFLLVTATAFFVLVALAALSGAVPPTRWIALAAFVALVSLALLLPGGPLFDSVALRVLVTALSAAIAVAAAVLAIRALRMWREARGSMSGRARALASSAAAAALAVVFAMFWTPVAWRSSGSGIERLAVRVRAAGIPVESTLVVYESLGRSRFYKYPEFQRRVIGALHRAGVTVIAGTDARGLPTVPPGTSFHRELQLLAESGFTPFEAIRAATVAPATFLRKGDDFGTIAVGKRADLLLVRGNPLRDLAVLARPVGVMARGHWLPQ
jgi:imidazolonepropionase-like amidohydrolase